MDIRNTSEYSWLKEHKKEIIYALIITYVAFGVMFVCPTIGIDEEKSLIAQEGYGAWISQGRIGVQLFSTLFTINGRYVPFLWDFLAVGLWFCSGVIYSYAILAKRKNATDRIELIWFLTYYSTLPFVVGEILSFSMFNLQVSLGMISAAIAFYLSVLYIKKNKTWKYRWLCLALMIVFLTYGLTVYQAILSLYITAVVIACIQKSIENEESLKRWIMVAVFTAIVSFVLYALLTKLCQTFTGQVANYTDSYIGWFDNSILYTAFMAIANVARVSFAITIQDVSIYGGIVICVCTVLFIIWSVVTFFREKERKTRFRILCYTVALVIAPFLIYIMIGTYKTHGRMLLALPLAGAMEIVFIYQSLKSRNVKKKSVMKMLLVGCMGYMIWLNVRNMNSIYYDDYIRYQQDQTVAREVMHDISLNGYNYHAKPVVFIGAYSSDTAEAFFDSSDSLGVEGSFFTWDGGDIGRIRELLVINGYMTIQPTSENILNALNNIEGMNPWPLSGSIKEIDDCIIVFFNTPTEEWYAVNGVQ